MANPYGDAGSLRYGRSLAAGEIWMVKLDRKGTDEQHKRDMQDIFDRFVKLDQDVLVQDTLDLLTLASFLHQRLVEFARTRYHDRVILWNPISKRGSTSFDVQPHVVSRKHDVGVTSASSSARPATRDETSARI